MPSMARTIGILGLDGGCLFSGSAGVSLTDRIGATTDIALIGRYGIEPPGFEVRLFLKHGIVIRYRRGHDNPCLGPCYI